MDVDDFETVRSLWRTATSSPNGFARPGWIVVPADGHRAAPDGWVGVIDLRGSVVVATPDKFAARLTLMLERVSTVSELTDPAAATAIFGPFRQTLGPAVLLYGRPIRPAHASSSVIGPLANDDPQVLDVISQAAPDEVDESALAETTSGVFVALDASGEPVAACGWRPWPHGVAHVSVLTAAEHRARGFGLAAAQAALNAAVTARLLPQWRAVATNSASIALATSLGMEPVGRQFSVLLDPAPLRLSPVRIRETGGA